MKPQQLLKPGGVGALLAALLVLAYTDECRAQTCIENPGSGPRICADWNEGDDPDHPDDFEVTFSDESFPNIELRAESLSWRLWSEDAANPNGIGDIGVISSPHPQNFGLKIEDDQGVAGAREVKGIILDPQGEGSDAKYSNLTGGTIAGNLTGNLTLQKSLGGLGGVASFQILGAAQGDITVREVSYLGVKGDVSGSIDVDEVTGSLQISGDVLGNIDVDTITGLLRVTGVLTNTSLDVAGSVTSTGQIDIWKAVGTTLTVNGCTRSHGASVLTLT